ncbi:hypothetical protein [Lentzea sp. NPDC060358]|uniref:hypothetical protein n=1 Tax=Lentzea sp. NPDC060358 TaxID=3347103 RepID=UPI0036582302
MTAAHDIDAQSEVQRLSEAYDEILRRFADDHGELPHSYAVEAAQLAHRLADLHDDRAEHWRRLSREHREGRSQR